MAAEKPKGDIKREPRRGGGSVGDRQKDLRLRTTALRALVERQRSGLANPDAYAEGPNGAHN